MFRSDLLVSLWTGLSQCQPIRGEDCLILTNERPGLPWLVTWLEMKREDRECMLKATLRGAEKSTQHIFSNFASRCRDSGKKEILSSSGPGPNPFHSKENQTGTSLKVVGGWGSGGWGGGGP